MSCHLAGLPKKKRRGSLARCLLLTEGKRQEVASRLNGISAPKGSVDPSRHLWAPEGFGRPDEAKLGETAPFLCAEDRETVTAWWLAVRPRANTPNWDVVSQITIEGREGLLLVEAKAHLHELKGEERGKPLKAEPSANSDLNHKRIGVCIAEASVGLSTATGLDWNLSRDHHYQMSNRFVWAFKLAEMGIPVVLVYLGFLNAGEMEDCGTPLASAEQWEACVLEHSASLFPAQVWGRRWDINGVPLFPLIRSVDWPLRCPACPGHCAFLDSVAGRAFTE